MADVAVAGAGQRDQAVGAFVEPLPLHLGAAAIRIDAICASQPVGELEIASARLDQEQRAERLVALGLVRQPDVAPEDRLHPRAPRRLVELDETERVGEIGDCERGHGVGHCGADRVVDAHGAVDDREFAVQAQVDEGGGGHGGAAGDDRILLRPPHADRLVCPCPPVRLRTRVRSRICSPSPRCPARSSPAARRPPSRRLPKRVLPRPKAARRRRGRRMSSRRHPTSTCRAFR